MAKCTIYKTVLKEREQEMKRLETFNTWPVPFISTEDLANSGFMYLGEDDKVRCVSGDIVVHSWEEDDIPDEEHQKLSPNCPLFMSKDTKRGKYHCIV